MAVTAGTVNVNNDNTGWSSADVMTALETVFSNLGMHGGTAKTGVPICTKWPGQTDSQPAQPFCNGINSNSHPSNTNFEHAGNRAAPWDSNRAERKFEASANGTTSYYMQETWQPTNVNASTDTITVPYNRVLTTGTELKFIPTGGTSDNAIGGLSLNQTVYVIRISPTEIKVAANSTDATNNQPITLTGAPVAGWGSTTRFWTPQSSSENIEIVTYQGDTLSFNVDAAGLNICDGSSYVGNKVLSQANASSLTVPPENTSGYITNVGTTSFTWNTGYWIQSEDNSDIESFDKPDTFHQGNVQQLGNSVSNNTAGAISIGGPRVVAYCYASANTSAMKGTITLLPKYSAYTYWNSYWKYTVPGTVTGGGGVGKDLKLRIYRWDAQSSSSYRGQISYIEIANVTDGWNTGIHSPTFTIPGDKVGCEHATTPSDYNIEFGTNTDETSTDAGDGICSIVTTNYGAGSTFFQKNANGHYAVLKMRHDNSKKYRDSYYTFYIDRSTPYRMCVKSGAYWETMNSLGTNANPPNQYYDDANFRGFYGFFDGIIGNNAAGNTNIDPNDTNNVYRHSYCTSGTPTDYRLRIKYWRAQSPQDDTFAVVSFVQVINDKLETFFTFSLPAAGFGVTTPGVDLDHLYHGNIVRYSSSTSNTTNQARALEVEMAIPQYENSSSHPLDENIDWYTRTGDSCYGYLRNDGTNPSFRISDRWCTNINTPNYEPDHDILTYYRNADYDGISGTQDYYRPIKGIPLLNVFAPCPYYMPDDFVMIQVGTAPGLTEFRTGDTITVSGGEVYTVIISSIDNSVTGLDGVASGSAIGMMFCARTT
tara:strand:+ start:68 stop:2533 length:2466 start_codon:yes stop_codon:yes gene_type:complete